MTTVDENEVLLIGEVNAHEEAGTAGPHLRLARSRPMDTRNFNTSASHLRVSCGMIIVYAELCSDGRRAHRGRLSVALPARHVCPRGPLGLDGSADVHELNRFGPRSRSAEAQRHRHGPGPGVAVCCTGLAFSRRREFGRRLHDTSGETWQTWLL